MRIFQSQICTKVLKVYEVKPKFLLDILDELKSGQFLLFKTFSSISRSMLTTLTFWSHWRHQKATQIGDFPTFQRGAVDVAGINLLPFYREFSFHLI